MGLFFQSGGHSRRGEQHLELLRESMSTLVRETDELLRLQTQARTKLGHEHPTQDLPWATLNAIRMRCLAWLESKAVTEEFWRS